MCRHYRSRRRPSSDTARLPHAREPLYAVYDPITRIVYADVPSTAEGTGALLDAVLSIDRTLGAHNPHGRGRKPRRPRYYPGKEVSRAFQPDKVQDQAGKSDLRAFLSCGVNA